MEFNGKNLKLRNDRLLITTVAILVTTLIACAFALVFQSDRSVKFAEQQSLQTARQIASISQATLIELGNKSPSLAKNSVQEDFFDTIHRRFSRENHQVKLQLVDFSRSMTTGGVPISRFHSTAKETIEKSGKDEFSIKKQLPNDITAIRLMRSIPPGQTSQFVSVTMAFPNPPTWQIYLNYTLLVLALLSVALGALVIAPAFTPFNKPEVAATNAMPGPSVPTLERKAQGRESSAQPLADEAYFNEMLAAYVEEFGKNDVDLGLICMDIDHLNTINEFHGPSAGDKLISALGKMIQSHVRKFDCAAHLDGGQFIILIPSASKTVLVDIAERLLQAAQKVSTTSNGNLVQSTMSAGVAMLRRKDSPQNLRERAYGMLDTAKKTGRNRVSF